MELIKNALFIYARRKCGSGDIIKFSCANVWRAKAKVSWTGFVRNLSPHLNAEMYNRLRKAGECDVIINYAFTREKLIQQHGENRRISTGNLEAGTSSLVVGLCMLTWPYA